MLLQFRLCCIFPASYQMLPELGGEGGLGCPNRRRKRGAVSRCKVLSRQTHLASAPFEADGLWRQGKNRRYAADPSASHTSTQPQGAGELLQCDPPRQTEHDILAIIRTARMRSASAGAASLHHVRSGRAGGREGMVGWKWMGGAGVLQRTLCTCCGCLRQLLGRPAGQPCPVLVCRRVGGCRPQCTGALDGGHNAAYFPVPS